MLNAKHECQLKNQSEDSVQVMQKHYQKTVQQVMVVVSMSASLRIRLYLKVHFRLTKFSIETSNNKM